MFIEKLFIQLSAFEYWSIATLIVFSSLGTIALIRELIISLFEAEVSKGRARQIYRQQKKTARITLCFLKTYFNDGKKRKLFFAYMLFYYFEIIVITFCTLSILLAPMYVGYSFAFLLINLSHNVAALIFLRTKFPSGFTGAPKYRR